MWLWGKADGRWAGQDVHCRRMNEAKGILFTAFEPSGDAAAAAVIAELRRRRPAGRIWALGGPRMAAAGAELIETTTQHPAMFAEAVGQAWHHGRRVGRLKRWLRSHAIAALVPVDSPAANWSICGAVRRIRPVAKIVHLVAPQLWAWAPWRIRKLRRLTDHVLCLLPFEPAWFEQRGVAATFVGHRLFEGGMDDRPCAIDRATRTDGEFRLALIPGSRASEIKANWPCMLEVFTDLQRTHRQLRGQVAAVDADRGELCRQIAQRQLGDWPGAIEMRAGDIGGVIDWCDAAVVVCGTATLDVAAGRRPMVAIFQTRHRILGRLARRWLITTDTFALPNLIGQWAGLGRIVAELAPLYGEVEPVREAVGRLIEDAGERQRQVAMLGQVAEQFSGVRYASAAAEQILRVMGEG